MTASIPDIQRALEAVGEQLAAAGAEASIVIVGGAAANLLGAVHRPTRDVDVIARRDPQDPSRLIPPDPLPAVLEDAARAVARDLRLPSDWLNTAVASQWQTGLPPGLETRVEWRTFGTLHVGIVARRDLVFLKLYAAADDVGPGSVHFQDLVALRPSPEELEAAAKWIGTQDPSVQFAAVVAEVIRHVSAR